MATSVLEGSDEVYEFVCEPCERYNQYEKGNGYCVDCSEYLCSTCLACHKKSRVSCDHKLLDKASIKQHGIPQKPPPLPAKSAKATPKPSKPSKPATQLGEFMRKCKKHNDEFTKLYCNDHDELVCTVCIVKDHNHCKAVTYIPDVSRDIRNSSEFKNLLTELKRIHALLDFENSRMLYNETRVEEIYQSALCDLAEFKDKMLRDIDRMYTRVEQDLTELRDEHLTSMSSWVDSHKRVQAEVEKLLINIENNISKANYNQLFVDMKLAKVEMYTLKQMSQRLSNNNFVTQYKFEGNYDIIDKLKSDDGIGNILKNTNSTNVCAELLHEMNVKSDNDADDCRINGALVLPDGDLALADDRNNSIKIIDALQKSVKAQTVLESRPFGIAFVEDDQVAVTLPFSCKIQILKLSNRGLTQARSISTDDSCYGIDYHDETLITVCHGGSGSDPGNVLVMDMNGSILRKINKDHLERFLFSRPRCLALSVDKNALYLTEEKNKRITLVSLKGEQIAEYQQPGHWEISNALGVATDKDGAVYITHGDGHSIYRLSHVCTRPQKLLSEADGLSRYPFAIALDRGRDLLYVGSVSSHFTNKIRVFKLKYHWT